MSITISAYDNEFAAASGSNVNYAVGDVVGRRSVAHLDQGKVQRARDGRDEQSVGCTDPLMRRQPGPELQQPQAKVPDLCHY